MHGVGVHAIGAVAIDVGLDVGADLVFRIGARAAEAHANAGAATDAGGRGHDEGIDGAGGVGVDAQIARGEHARVLQEGAHLGCLLDHTDLPPQAGVAVLLDAQVEGLGAVCLEVAVDRERADVLVDVAGQCAFTDVDAGSGRGPGGRLQRGHRDGDPLAAGVTQHVAVGVGSDIAVVVGRRAGGRVVADEIARHRDAHCGTDADTADAASDGECRRDDLGVDAAGAGGVEIELANSLCRAADLAVLDKGVGARQDDVGRFGRTAGHANGRLADGDSRGGGHRHDIDRRGIARAHGDVAAAGADHAGDVDNTGLNVLVDLVVRQCQPDADAHAGGAGAARHTGRRGNRGGVDRRDVARGDTDRAACRDSGGGAGQAVADRRLDVVADLVETQRAGGVCGDGGGIAAEGNAQ